MEMTNAPLLLDPEKLGATLRVTVRLLTLTVIQEEMELTFSVPLQET